MSNDVTKEQRFNEVDPLLCDDITADALPSYRTLWIKESNQCNQATIAVTLHEARALRDWLNKVIP